MNQLVLLGRVFYSAVFLISVPGYFTDNTIRYVAAQGLPLAGFVVPLLGSFALMGGVSILIGYRAKAGACLLVLFLAPMTVTIHNYWAIVDPAAAALQWSHFLKNLSLLGSALLIAYFGSGPLSLENYLKRRDRDRHGTRMIDLTAKRR